MVGTVYSKTVRQFVLFGLAFVCFFTGLVITQSRGYWVAFIVAGLSLFFIADKRIRLKLVVWVLTGLIVTLVVGYTLLPNLASLIFEGLWERLTSLGSAFTNDISLVNRFYESKTVWAYITSNPILGYGIGASYSYFNIIEDSTRNWAFVHNGYVGIWFKFGLIGLIVLLTVWLRCIIGAIASFKTTQPKFASLVSLICALCLISLAVVANTSNPFLKEDTMLMFAVMTGFVSGYRDRGGLRDSAKIDRQ